MDWEKKVIREAEKAMENGEVPIAAIIVEEGEEVARSQARVARDNETAAHAELLAIKKAGATWDRDLVLYTNLEPCIMCQAAARRCGIDRIVYSMEAPNEESLKPEKRPVMVQGERREESRHLFKSFLQENPEHFATSYVEELLNH